MNGVRKHVVKDLRGREYVLHFRGATLTIVPEEGGTPAVMAREAFASGATILDGILSRRTVVLPTLGHLSLRLDQEAFQTLRAWIQPSRHIALARALRRITVWQFLLGGLFFATSGPWINEGGTWDVPMAALGVLAITVGVLTVTWPRRWVYALEMVWSVTLAAVVASWVAGGDSSPLWFGVSILLMVEAFGYGRLFMFWSPVREAARFPDEPDDSDDDDSDDDDSDDDDSDDDDSEQSEEEDSKSDRSMFEPPDK